MKLKGDLFGGEIDERLLKKRSTPLPRGHAFRPGTGSTGETCGSCKHLYRRHMAKTYLKCALNEKNWTGGGASDVRAKDPACKFWERG